MKDLKWEILDSTYLFNDTWFKVRKDTCRKPDGTIVSPYYVYEFPTWVTVLAITRDQQVVMVKQYRHAIGEVSIEIPGGCVDDTDENLEHAISRELKEETGYSFEKFYYLGKTSPNPSTNSNWMHMFLATGGEKVSEQQLDEHEEIEVMLYSMEELKQLIREHKIIQAMHVTCIHYALEKLEELSVKNA